MSIAGVLRRQAGVISRAQALGAGMGPSTISRRLSSRSWVRVHPQVYLVADHDLTAEARLRAAMLWAGPGATVSGLGAAWWHRLWPDPPAMIDLTVRHGWKRRSQPGVRVRRRDLMPEDRTEVNGVLVTAAPLTVLEAAAELRQAGSRLLDRALQRRLALDDIYRAHCRNLGRHGSAASAELLRAAGDRAASEAERLTIALLRRAGIDGWRCGYRIRGYDADIAFPASGVVVEIDGWAWHSDVDRFDHDRRRQNALVLAGWTVLRFTWRDLTCRPETVLAEIRGSLARAA
jgi:very-short-patch-repair endonuclease